MPAPTTVPTTPAESDSSQRGGSSSPEFMNTETEAKDPIKEFLKLAELVRDLCPDDCISPDHGKYAQLSVGGYERALHARVFFDGECSFDVASFEELKSELSKRNPGAARQARISALKAELARLEAV